MTAARQTAALGGAAPLPQTMFGEWFWRFLAVIMLVTVAWVLWIIYQLNPQPLLTKAGFEAAARARAVPDAKGVITLANASGIKPAGAAAPAGDGSGQAASAQAVAPKPAVQAPPPEPKQPPVNAERLKFADSIETPIPERGRKK